jgi:spermidine synthase
MGRANKGQRADVQVEDGRVVLRVGGVIQSVAVDESYESDVWDAMLPQERPANALILGLGGGTIAQFLTQRWGPLPITGVERDPSIALIARHAFGLEQLPHVRIVVADAFEFVGDCRERYDLICVDLYVAGKMAHGVLDPAFLRAIARLLSPDGTAAFNFWSGPYLADQIRRLGRVLPIRDRRSAGDNVVIICGTHPVTPSPSGAAKETDHSS